VALPRLELEHNRNLIGPLHKDGPSFGNDVLAVKRMLKRWDEGLFSGTLATLDKVYNQRTVNAVIAAQRFWRKAGAKIEISGVWDEETHERSLRALRDQGQRYPQQLAWDALAISLYKSVKPEVPPARCFIFPQSVPTTYLGGVKAHMARPLGNWQSDNAIDVHAPAGSIVVSPKRGYVSKGGGYDPHNGPVGTIFGEHTTIEFDDNTRGFVTHLDRIVSIGERVVAGEIIGKVGDWPHSFIMDHAHFGAEGFNPEAMLKWPRVRIPYSD
jgi:murein DD-endopeptidase MepM/ murein hydrolase activator NlpD